MSVRNDVCLDAWVVDLPKGETDIHLTPRIVLIPSMRKIDLELVSASLFGHATAALEARTEFPE